MRKLVSIGGLVSKKKLSVKDLILFLVGFLAVSITALGVGFFVLPLVLEDSSSDVVTVEEVQTETPKVQVEPKVEEVKPPPPNVLLATQSRTMRVMCDGDQTGEGQKVDIFLSKKQTCSIEYDKKTVKVQLSPDERYFCFFDGYSSCRTEKEHKTVEQEKAAQKKAVQAKPTKQVKKTSGTLKNEAEVIVTGPATLTISADSDAIIFVDGKKIRKAPLFKYDVSPGSHKVDIISQVDFKKRKTFTLQTESGMNYIRQWSFQDNTWLKKIP